MIEKALRVGWILVGDQNVPSARIEGYKMHGWLKEHGVDSKILSAPTWGYDPVLHELTEISGLDILILQKVCLGKAMDQVLEAKKKGIMVGYYLSDLTPEADPIYKQCDILIMSSEYLMNSLPKELRDKCYRIPDAYETPKFFCKTEYSTDKIVVLWFGTLGGWDAAAKLRPTIESLGYEYRMISLHPEAYKQWDLLTIWDDIKESDIVIIPSALTEYDKCKDENRLTQTMVIGVPVIASPVPAYLKLVKQFKNGIIAYGDDWSPYLKMLKDKKVREQIGKAGRETVVERYHIDTIGQEFLNILNDIKEPKVFTEKPEVSTKKRNTIILYFPVISYTTALDQGLHRFPYAIATIAGPLRDAGFNVIIHDARVDEERHFKNALEEDPLFVGISSITGVQLQDAMRAAKEVKELHPEIPIIWGGWHVSLLPEQAIQEPFVDAVVVGPGEEIIVEIAKTLQSGAKIMQGQIFKGNPLISYPRIPFDMFDIGKYGPYFGYLTSHGCQWDCTFCAIAQIYKRKFYFRNIDHVIEDLKYIVDNYPRKLVNLNIDDDNFFNNKQRVIEFCDKWNDYGHIPISMLAHVRILLKYTDNDWIKLYRAGIKQILIGAESGNQVILDRLKKYQTPEQMLQFVKKASEFGINPELSCMTGFPDSDELGDFKDTILFLKEAGAMCPSMAYKMFWIRPYPGTALFKDFQDQGYKMPSNMRQWSDYTLRKQPPWVSNELEEMVNCFVYAFQPQTGWNFTWEQFIEYFKMCRAYGKIPRPMGL